MKVKSSIFIQNVTVYKVLFHSHLHFIQSLKVKLQGSAEGHTWPPPGMPHWPESGSEVSLEDSGQGSGNRSTTVGGSRQKYQWRAMVISSPGRPSRSTPPRVGRRTGRAQIQKQLTSSNREEAWSEAREMDGGAGCTEM